MKPHQLIFSAAMAALALPFQESSAFPAATDWVQRTTSITSYGVQHISGLFLMDNGGPYSPDGITWTDMQPPPYNYWLTGSSYGDGTFVVAGAAGQIFTSTDYENWIVRNVGGEDITSICYGAGTFVARKYHSTGDIWVSKDKGASWTSVDTGDAPDRTYNVITHGNNIFMYPLDNRVRTSVDGLSWTTHVISGIPAGLKMRSADRFSDGVFIGAAETGRSGDLVQITTASSPDGVNWTYKQSTINSFASGSFGTAGAFDGKLLLSGWGDPAEVWLSEDAGGSWRKLDGPWSESGNTTTNFASDGKWIAVATATGIYSAPIATSRTVTVSGQHGSVTGGGTYDQNTTATLTAIADPGYVFTGWTGDASGTINPLSIVMDSDKTIGATFAPDLSDADDDLLTTYDEVTIYGTDPASDDTDGDGLKDGWEIGFGRFSIVPGSFTWAQARADAHARGGELACFPTEDRWNCAMQTLGAGALDPYLGLWIGATDEVEDGVWTWVNGQAFSFSLWATGRPSITAGNTLDHAEVCGGDGAEIGKWYDRSPTSVRDGYILETGRATDPTIADVDGDGLNDGQEQAAGSDPFVADSDGDGLTDSQEVNLTHTNPTLADTDGNGTQDGEEDPDGDGLDNLAEVNTHGTDPLAADTDGDGLRDPDELGTTITDPKQADSDSNGTPDGEEDPDNDGLPNVAEVNTHGTDPLAADPDEDGLNDGQEVNLTHTNPKSADSDGNGTPDGDEDPDADGLTNLAEVNTHGTDPLAADTDGDGLGDGYEVGVGRFRVVWGDFRWDAARRHALARECHLATFANQEEWDAALAGLEEDPFPSCTGLWIGATDAAQEGVWTWVTGEPFGFNLWAAGQPNNSPGDQDAAEVSGWWGSAAPGEWVDTGAMALREGYLLEEGWPTDPAVADTDGDSYLDGAEAEFLGDPLAAGTTPRIKARMVVDPAGGNAQFRFLAEQGYTYSIEASANLVDWQTLETGITGTGGTAWRDYPMQGLQMRYFRARRD